MAMLCADEYPDLDIDKVIKMCLIHDFGEAITGDVPAFWKNAEHEKDEEKAIETLISSLPSAIKEEMVSLFSEMKSMNTEEAKLYKSLDNIEAVLSHNEADISTWISREYQDNLTYGAENCDWSVWIKNLRDEVKQDSIRKINEKK